MMNQNNLYIQKASGEKAIFSPDKLSKSLQRSGADSETVDYVLRKVQESLYEGIPTKKIYRMAFNLLKKQSYKHASKYKLKQAIMELGPSGFPFEKYVAELLKKQGYEAKTNEIIQGHCVKHEVDVVAMKDEKHFMIECKFHNEAGFNTDVKVPLYIYARFKDIEQQWVQLPGHDHKLHQAWVVTNTKFSEDALQYGTCMGMNLIGWNYPIKESLRELIDREKLYPVTCLHTLTAREKEAILNLGYVLSMDICDNPKILSQVHITVSRQSSIIEECKQLCHNGGTHE